MINVLHNIGVIPLSGVKVVFLAYRNAINFKIQTLHKILITIG